MISEQAQKWIKNYMKRNAHRYTWRNYTDMAIQCGVDLVRQGSASRYDVELMDYLDDAARDAVEWPDESTLGYED